MASIFLIFALLSLSGLGICHKVADFHHCKPAAINVTLFSTAAAALWAYTLYEAIGLEVGLFPPFTMSAVMVAAVCGACAGLAILTFQIGVRYGRISTSWLVINLSTIVPSGLSLVIYQEWKSGIKWQQITALVLILLSVVLLWKDKAVELASEKQDRGFPVSDVVESQPAVRGEADAAAAGQEA